MDERRQEFIEKMGLSFERSGAAPMLGRVWGALLISNSGFHTAEELAIILQASRGAISHATRQLATLRYIEKFRKPGDRKDYFRIIPQGLALASGKRMVEVHRIQDLLHEALELMPDAPELSIRTVTESIAFMDGLNDVVEQFIADWTKNNGDQRAKRYSNDSSDQNLRQEPWD